MHVIRHDHVTPYRDVILSSLFRKINERRVHAIRRQQLSAPICTKRNEIDGIIREYALKPRWNLRVFHRFSVTASKSEAKAKCANQLSSVAASVSEACTSPTRRRLQGEREITRRTMRISSFCSRFRVGSVHVADTATATGEKRNNAQNDANQLFL